MVSKQEVRQKIEAIGIIPSVRVSSAVDAMFAAEALLRGGIPIMEIALTLPDAFNVISQVAQRMPDMIVGAGGVPDVETARHCVRAGAFFLASDGLDPDTVKFALQEALGL
jgi:2-dehydro-3-deoxyphosphogluconate aldolase/(4S)-4-hydroxy-2-oxoglutarate aldolase